MIVNPQGDRLVIIPQINHADLSGQFATHWGNIKFDRLEPSAAMVQSIYHHDDGWKSFDENPPLSPDSKKPLDFYKLPTAYSLKIHEETVERTKGLDLYARLMISKHRTGLLFQRYGTEKGWEIRDAVKKEGVPPELRKFADTQEAWQEEAENQLRHDGKQSAFAEKSHVWTNYKLVQVFDRLSLFVCQSGDERKVSPAPTRYGKEADVELSLFRPDLESLELDPWPFDLESFKVNVTTYQIENKEYQNSEEVARSLYSDPSSEEVLRIEVKKK
jgi:hypothetical protein